MNTTKCHSTSAVTFLQNIIANGGPEPKEYNYLNHLFDSISDDYRSGKITGNELQLLQNGFGDECLENTLHGHIKSKPFGYAGDFLIIDKIYQEQITKDQRFVKWDTFWNNHSACKAVRNRKDYFIRTMANHIAANDRVRLLNVASGPARDVAELYSCIDAEKLHTVCVEADATAIQYAQNLNEANAARIQFIHKNIFRFSTGEKFDIVWSAGLFDYFDDKLFVKLLRRFISWTKPGGEVIIGNFSTQNPSRNYMELVGDWFLEHRSENQLIKMAVEAGAIIENISVGKELEGVNLFLHIKA